MITCPKCGKENQDHYKFCLGCGAELPREQVPRPFATQTPPHGMPAVGGLAGGTLAVSPSNAPPQGGLPGGTAVLSPSAAQALPQAGAPPATPPPVAAAAPAPQTSPIAPAIRPSAAPAAAGSLDCPQCGQQNPPANRFCASCGYNLASLKSARPAAAPVSDAPAPATVMALALTALRADGSEAGTFRLPDAQVVSIGRDTGSIFAGDSYLSPRHASFTRRDGKVLLKDEDSLNGVYVKLKPNTPWPIVFGDIFRIGQEIIRFEELKALPPSAEGVQRFGSPAKGYIGRLALVVGRDTTGNAYLVPAQGIHCGRERGDILFSEDGYVSGLHCRIFKGDDGRVYLMDIGSSNGTFVRLRAEQTLIPGDILLMGQQLFRVDY
ncbi:MAG: FHA domain-containing protein [Polyangiaceae bacterium]|nr:FHA domain-containing protein [Polyangiaceae bacterium]